MKWTQRNSLGGVHSGVSFNIHAGFSNTIFHTIIQTMLKQVDFEAKLNGASQALTPFRITIAIDITPGSVRNCVTASRTKNVTLPAEYP